MFRRGAIEEQIQELHFDINKPLPISDLDISHSSCLSDPLHEDVKDLFYIGDVSISIKVRHVSGWDFYYERWGIFRKARVVRDRSRRR